MKLHYVLISLLGLVAAFPALGQEETKSAQSSEVSALIELASMKSEADRIIKEKEAEIDSLKLQNEERIQNLTSLFSAKIDSLNNVIKAKDLEMEDLQLSLISAASNFLYLPFDQYSITEIVDPAFEAVKGNTALYTRYRNRLVLLDNYEKHSKELINFLKNHENDEVNIFRAEEWAKSTKNEFNALSVVSAYKTYDDWPETYLGKIITDIDSSLSSGNPSEEKVRATFKAKREYLENMLTAGH